MIAKIIRYLYPRRRLHSIPKHITAEYVREQMNTDEQLIMMAGLARDPDEAKHVYQGLHQTHGNKVYRHIQLILKRKRTTTARERLMMLLRQLLGEDEPRKYARRRDEEPIVKTDYRIKREETP